MSTSSGSEYSPDSEVEYDFYSNDSESDYEESEMEVEVEEEESEEQVNFQIATNVFNMILEHNEDEITDDEEELEADENNRDIPEELQGNTIEGEDIEADEEEDVEEWGAEGTKELEEALEEGQDPLLPQERREESVLPVFEPLPERIHLLEMHQHIFERIGLIVDHLQEMLDDNNSGENNTDTDE